MSEKKEETLDEKKCREAVNYDLKMAIAFLNLLYKSPELMASVEELVVDKMRAHYENKKLNPELPLTDGVVSESTGK